MTRLWTRCNKILGTDCASRPRMTGAGDVDLVPPANLLTKLETCFHRILCTRHRMTGAGGASLLFVATHLPLTRSEAPTSPSRGEVAGLPRFARNDDRARGEVVILILNALFPKVSFFPPNSVNLFAAAEKAPLIRCSGFTERERETFGLLIFHLSFLLF